MRPSRLLTIPVVALVSLGGLAACGEDDDGGRTLVEVFGPVVGDNGERLGDLLREASEGTGVELRYVGVTSFEEQLQLRMESGDRPAIALLPQPGLLEDLASRGALVPLAPPVVADVTEATPSALSDLVVVDGAPAAAWLTVDVKGLLWFRPELFERLGLEVPRTLDELTELADAQRVADGGIAPFCLGLHAGASTGWVGTDWIESLLLRRSGPTVYDEWTSGDVTFDRDEVVAAFDELDQLLRARGAVAGGTADALGDAWESVAEELLADEPVCLMAHQGDFLRREFPSGVDVGPGLDVDFVPLPGEADGTAPLLLGGMMAAPLDDAPGVQEAMSILAGTDLAQRLDESGAFLSPNRLVDRSSFDDTTTARLLDLLAAASVVRFDGSDLMPPALGSGSFWSGMNAFFAGDDVDAVVSSIEAGRPAG